MVHLIFIASPSPSHVLPLYGMAQRFAAEPGVTVTFLASDVTVAELRRLGAIPEVEAGAAASIRCIGLPSSGAITYSDLKNGPASLMKLYQDLIDPATVALKALAAGEEVVDAWGHRFSSISPAVAVVASPFIFFGPPVAKEFGLHWATFLHTSPPGSAVTLCLAEAAAKADAPDTVLLAEGIELAGVGHFDSSEFINVFGEDRLVKSSPTIWLATGFRTLLEQSDSLLLNSTLSLDAVVLPHLQPHSRAQPIPIFGVGPVDIISTSKSFEEEKGFLDFLSEQEKKGRPCILASFGALGSLLEAEKNELIAAAAAETELAFIIADKTAPALEVSSRAHENILLAPWIPQGQLLEQNSVQLFIGHAGWNGALEALRAGVPQLVRPFKAAELVVNARYLSDVHKVARYVSSSESSGSHAMSYADAFAAFRNGSLATLASNARQIGIQLSADLAPGASRDQEVRRWLESLGTRDVRLGQEQNQIM
ncbi:glycosyltransferase family 1 protein [Tilletiaria anomala UBC 951]|uniref:Glycosyltransferase family 1 protein n=1 Tax=Tilletiaria anomala (strain ATCC 24038 / CBS 436.72 / UBC 951) TaxID=1037660 RepID=A0A066VZL1_TILAU|nr:glycosyltransferase family 1 protein [Tilletiaria anomala UBC 951]KDN47172.1 glycosyltransferase family 1 protein [Tilletiaria anomala UBC 951]